MCIPAFGAIFLVEGVNDVHYNDLLPLQPNGHRDRLYVEWIFHTCGSTILEPPDTPCGYRGRLYRVQGNNVHNLLQHFKLSELELVVTLTSTILEALRAMVCCGHSVTTIVEAPDTPFGFRGRLHGEGICGCNVLATIVDPLRGINLYILPALQYFNRYAVKDWRKLYFRNSDIHIIARRAWSMVE